MLLAVMVGQNMVSAALGLANGLAESLINMKAMFPGTQAGGGCIIIVIVIIVIIIIMIIIVSIIIRQGAGC